jgi:AraC family transcriptional regulator, transcriptional activator of the genes for pyochelin and ferripyochelin receptors
MYNVEGKQPMNAITRTANDAVLVQQHVYPEDSANALVLVEQTTNISFPSAEFTSQRWTFDGIGIIRQRWMCEGGGERNKILWNHDFDGVYTDYLLSGQQTATNSRWQKALVMTGRQHSVSYTNGYEGETWSDTPQSEMVMFKINKPTWLRLTHDGNDTLQRFAENVLEGRSMHLSEHNLPLTQQMSSVIQQILNCHFTGGLKKMFLYSKCLELIVLQAEAFNYHETLCNHSSQNSSTLARRVSRSDKERLHFAQDYLRHHLEEPPSLPELARVAGLNEYKLKREFKEVFGTTVFGFVAEHRLERAQMLLSEREKSVSEIAYELGYSSPQHFSTAFKKKFGMPPKFVRS